MKGPLSRKGSRTLLSLLMKYPKRRFSINELAKSGAVPFGTAWNIVKEWESGGIVNTEKIGKSVAVSLGSGPYLEMTKKALEMPSSPHRMALGEIARRLRKAGVRTAYLFGSVAEGREKPSSDVDIALVGAKMFDAAREAMALHKQFSVKVVFLEFKNEKELLSFLSGKKNERVV